MSVARQVNLMRSILWQYEQSPKILELARKDQEWIDTYHNKFWEDWYRDVYNLKTANPFGLVVWSKILNREIIIKGNSAAKDSFGFDGANTPSVDNFNYNNAGFAFDFSNSTVSVDTARTVLLMRWWELTSVPTIPNLNLMLKDIFGSGRAYVADNWSVIPMTIIYQFNIEIPYDLTNLFDNHDVLPRPSCVDVSWNSTPQKHFRYDAPDNFDNNSFLR